MRSSTFSSEAAALRLFSFKLALFLAMQVVIALAVITPFQMLKSETYIAELTDKQQRLETAPSPRMILIGASNLAFSFDSQRVIDETDFTPVNMGLHMGLGLEMPLNESLQQVRAGDAVVLAFEYIHYQRDATTDIIVEAAMNAPHATAQGMDFKIFQHTADEALAMLGRRTRTLTLMALGIAPYRPVAPYRHDSFNEFGEIVAHRNLPPQHDKLGEPLMLNRRRLDAAIDALNEFAAECRMKGASVYLTYAPYPQPEYDRDEQYLTLLHRTLVERLTFPIITTPAETVYPVDAFYDTEYHTLPPATARRTELIIRRVEALVKHQPAAAGQ